MPWEAKYNCDDGYVELIYNGLISPKDLYDALIAATHLAEENHSILFLADCSNMVGGHSIVDLYGLISLYESVGLNLKMKEALLLPSMKSAMKDVEFYETSCWNKGFNVKVFTSRREALSWLTDK